MLSSTRTSDAPSPRTIQRVATRAAAITQLNERVTSHRLRHSFFRRWKTGNSHSPNTMLLSASGWKVPNSIAILQCNWNFVSSTCSAPPNPIHDLKEFQEKRQIDCEKTSLRYLRATADKKVSCETQLRATGGSSA
jgi:hypothetical protein